MKLVLKLKLDTDRSSDQAFLDVRKRYVACCKEQRRERFSWSFHQLQQFIVYKAKLAGIPVMFVPAAYTSKTCSRCHGMSDANRRNQAVFRCTNSECRFLCHADENAAINIRFLGGASTAHKRTVSMQEHLRTDRRKPLALARR